MTALDQQIVSMYETLDMDPEEISDDLDCEIEAVKLSLKTHSGEYNKALKHEIEDITDDEYDQINRAYKQLALFSENDAVREKALRRLRDEKRGRLKSVGNLKSLKVNVIQINDSIKKARMLALKNLNRTEEAIEV